jgi:hypothetical protein
MMIAMKKVFGFPFMNSGSGEDSSAKAKSEARAAIARASAKMPIDEIKLRMELALHDVKGPGIDRLQYRIRATRSADDLWLLRSDMYQAISMLHSQAEAALRINGLLACFSQWIPTRQLTRI